METVHEMDRQQSVEGPVPESELECSCCYELMVDPTSINCGHSFCRICLARWSLQKRTRECPVCRQPWHGQASINFSLRETINRTHPTTVERRRRDIDSNPESENILQRFEQALNVNPQQRQLQQQQLQRLGFRNVGAQLQRLFPPQQQLEQNRQAYKYQMICIGMLICVAAFLIIWLLWGILSYFFTVDLEALDMKPIAKWTVDDVVLWLAEIGPWTQDTLVPIFQNNSIDGRLLMAMDDSDLDMLLEKHGFTTGDESDVKEWIEGNEAETAIRVLPGLHRRAFFMALVNLRQHEMKPIVNIWQYKAMFLGRTLLFMHSMYFHPRLAVFTAFLFDYEDSFLPFAHATSSSSNEMSAIYLYSQKFDPLTLSQWVDISVKWVFLPYWLVVQFLWTRMFSTHWILGLYHIPCLLFMMCAEITEFYHIYMKDGPKRPVIEQLCTKYVRSLQTYVIPLILWNFVPTFLWTILFYWLLLLQPAANVKVAYDQKVKPYMR